MSALVLPLYPRLQAGSAEAEERFSRIIDGLRRVRIQSRIVTAQLEEFARQFVEDDQYEVAGPARGQALDRAGRRARLDRMASLHAESLDYAEKERELLSLLARLEAATQPHRDLHEVPDGSGEEHFPGSPPGNAPPVD